MGRYLEMQCLACDWTGMRWANTRRCPQCGEPVRKANMPAIVPARLQAIIQKQNARIVAQGQEEARLHEQCRRLTEDLHRMQETCDGQRARIYELERENAHLQRQLVKGDQP